MKKPFYPTSFYHWLAAFTLLITFCAKPCAAEAPILEFKRNIQDLPAEKAVPLIFERAEIVSKRENPSDDELQVYYQLAKMAIFETNDTAFQIDTIFKFGKLFWKSGLPDEALKVYRQAASLAKLNKIPRLSEIIFHIAIVHFEQLNFESAIVTLERCIDSANQYNEQAILPRCANLLANIHNQQGRPTKAIPLLQTALKIEKEAGNERALAAIVNNLGLSFSKLGEPDQAIEYYLQSLVLEEKLGNIQGKVISLMNVATIYYHDLLDKDSAFDYLNKAISLAEEKNIEDTIALLYVNKAGFYFDDNLTEQARIAYSKAIEFAKSSGDLQSEVRAYLGLGNLHMRSEQASKALENFRLAAAGSKTLGSEQERIISLIGLGTALYALGQKEEGIDKLKQALEISKQTRLINQLVKATSQLAGLYAQSGDFESAYMNLLEYTEYLNQVSKQQNQEAIARYKTRYETEQKEAEIALLKKANELKDLERKKDKRIQFWLYAFIAMIFITALVILNRYFAEQKSNKIIDEKNKELTKAYEKLKTISLTDPLTEIPNRRAMHQYLEDELTRFERNRNTFSIVLMDIDHFKKINDNYGHSCGDLVLIETTRLIEKHIRKQDRFCRWGGEEFLLLLPDTNLFGARVLAEKIRGAILHNVIVYEAESESNKMPGASPIRNEIKITMTMGVSEYNNFVDRIETCIRDADHKLYQGKERGRNCVI